MTVPIRRLLVAAGTAHYDDEDLDDLPCVEADLEQLPASFDALGSSTALRLLDPTTEELRRALADWARAEYRENDAVILYYSGHGATAGGRHFFLCRDSESGQLHSTAIEAERLVKILIENGITRILLVIDTCYAAQGAIDALRDLAKDIAVHPGIDASRLVALSVIAAARTNEEAEDGVFAKALHRAITSHDLGGHRQQGIHLEPLVARIREHLPADRPQHVSLSILLGGGDFVFLPNPRYVPDLPDQDSVPMDLAEQATWATSEGIRRRAELQAHFSPRGRGADGLPGDGSYFTGRTRALAHLVGWLDEGPHGPGRHVVVTGGPGVGKSSLLGRLILLTDPAGAARLGDVPPGLLPRGIVHTAIHARHKRLEDIVAGIADAAGLPDDGLAALLRSLAGREEPLFVVVDALDEAGGADMSGEPARIATVLLHPLSELPCVRLLVGTRRLVVPALGDGFTAIDLDERRWSDPGEIETYARRLLAAPHGPASSGPYARDGIALAEVAQEIAHRAAGVFLAARLLARTLAQHDRVLDMTETGWRDRLQGISADSSPEPVFRWALREALGEQEELGRALLGALALSEGGGLPAGSVWTTMASAVSGRPVGDADVSWILGAAATHLVETTDSAGRSCYRLFHESFAEELRTALDPDVLERVAGALLARVPRASGSGDREWAAADPYLRAHLASHLAPHELFHEVVTDPMYLLSAEPGALQTALAVALPRMRLDSAPDKAAAAACEAWLTCAPLLRDEPDPAEAAAKLRLAATHIPAPELAAALDTRFPELPWRVKWARLAPKTPHRAIGTFDGPVNAVAVLPVQGRQLLAAAEASGPIRLLDFETGEPRGVLPRPPGGPADELVSYHDTETAWLLIRSGDTVSVWDMESRQELGPAYEEAGSGLRWCALTRFSEIPVAALVNSHGVVTVLDARSGEPRAHLRVARTTDPDSGGVACSVHEHNLIVASSYQYYRQGQGLSVSTPVATMYGHSVHRFTFPLSSAAERHGTWRPSEARTARPDGSTTGMLAIRGAKVLVFTQWSSTTDLDGARLLDKPWVQELPFTGDMRIEAVLPRAHQLTTLVVRDGEVALVTGGPADRRVVASVPTGDRSRPMAVASDTISAVTVVTASSAGGPLRSWTLTGGSVAPYEAEPWERPDAGPGITIAEHGGCTLAVIASGDRLTALDVHSGGPKPLPMPMPPGTDGSPEVVRGATGLPFIPLFPVGRLRGKSIGGKRAFLPDGTSLALNWSIGEYDTVVAAAEAGGELLVRFDGTTVTAWNVQTGTKVRRSGWWPAFEIVMPRERPTGGTLTVGRSGGRLFAAVAMDNRESVPVYELPSLQRISRVPFSHRFSLNDRGQPVVALGDWCGTLAVGAFSGGRMCVTDPVTGSDLLTTDAGKHTDVTALHLFTATPDGDGGTPLPMAALCADDRLILIDGRDGRTTHNISLGARIQDWAWVSQRHVVLRTGAGVLSLDLSPECFRSTTPAGDNGQ